MSLIFLKTGKDINLNSRFKNQPREAKEFDW